MVEAGVHQPLQGQPKKDYLTQSSLARTPMEFAKVCMAPEKIGDPTRASWSPSRGVSQIEAEAVVI